MASFSIRNPYLIIVCALVVCLVGGTVVARMPVDMFPTIDLTVVVIATFYAGMPPEQVEKNITERQERFFTLAPGIEHIESRSLTGVSIIKIFFQPGTNPDAAVSAMTKNQVIAFVITVVICFGFLISGFPPVINFFSGWAPQAVVDAISSFSFLTHFDAISKGVIDFRDLFFFGTLIAVCLFSTAAIVDLKKGG